MRQAASLPGGHRRAATALVAWLALASCLDGVAGAQTPKATGAPPTAAASPPTPTGSPTAAVGTAPAPGGAAAAGVPMLGPTGGRVGAGEVTIVGGNVASARERALADALKQAVDQAIGALVPDARAGQPKTVSQVLGRARGYVRRYRTLEEGERGRGVYAVRIEAEIDEAALQRAFDRPIIGGGTANPGTTGATGATAQAPSYLVVGAGLPEVAAIAGQAFSTAGARIQLAAPELMDPTKAVEAAARAGLANVAFVSGTVTIDGKVRGPGVEAVTCVFDVRVLAAGSGLAVANESETLRSFADRTDAARNSCLKRAAAAAIPRVVPAAGARTTPEMRTIVLDADIVEPGAVPALVKHLRGIGSVSAVEVRRINGGRVELWVRSRLAGPALAAALGRDTGGVLVVSGPEVSGDLVRLRARLREGATPAAAISPPGTIPSMKSPSP